MIQTEAPDEMRGRVLSLYSMIILGFVPIGGLVFGSIGSAIGLPAVYVLGGAIGILTLASVWLTVPVLRRA
jgi:hypothetical protein